MCSGEKGAAHTLIPIETLRSFDTSYLHHTQLLNYLTQMPISLTNRGASGLPTFTTVCSAFASEEPVLNQLSSRQRWSVHEDTLNKLNLLAGLATAAAGKPTSPSFFGNDPPLELPYDIPNLEFGVDGLKAGLEELEEELLAT